MTAANTAVTATAEKPMCQQQPPSYKHTATLLNSLLDSNTTHDNRAAKGKINKQQLLRCPKVKPLDFIPNQQTKMRTMKIQTVIRRQKNKHHKY